MLFRSALKVMRMFAVMFPILMFILNGSTVAVVWFGAKLIDTDQIQIGSLTAFIAYLMQILANVMMGVMMSLMIPRAEASAERVQEILGTESSISESPEIEPIKNVSGVVEFRNVEFKYPGAEHSVLSGITFTAKPGEFTAIIGGTGSGKSTLLNLIPRFMEVTSGEVFVNNVDVRKQNLEALWANIGLVPQRSLLFRGTIRDNLKYGLKAASEDRKSTRLNSSHEWISRMPSSA